MAGNFARFDSLREELFLLNAGVFLLASAFCFGYLTDYLITPSVPQGDTPAFIDKAGRIAG